jgi:tRNA pseudouridine32 synthase/23S rRNA pseudouridine746 synthase
MTDGVFELHLEVEEAAKAIDTLAANSDLSKQLLKQAMKNGCVWHTQGSHTKRIRRADKHVAIAEQLHCYYDPMVMAAQPSPAIQVADEHDYSVWVKPRGMFSQGSRWGDHCTINRWIEMNSAPQRPCFIVHRLDRAATGLMLLAHSKLAAAKLSALFAQRQLDKHYRVIVEGEFVAPESVLIDSTIDDKDAKTIINSMDYCPASNKTLLDVKIETGRKHQIRLHLSEAGFPVIGDSLYGCTNSSENLALAAYSLRFICPLSGEEKYYQLPASYCPSL